MAIWRMDSVEIYGNDMKSLLILRELIDSKKDAKLYALLNLILTFLINTKSTYLIAVITP